MRNAQAEPLPKPSGKFTPGDKKFSLSLVIPCYNESKRIDLMMAGIAEFEELWKSEYEVIVVDDGSTDGTSDKVKEALNTKYSFLKDRVHVETMPANGGKGAALKKGVSLANGDYILTLDADMSTKPAELINWHKRQKDIFSQENTIYIGSRKHEEGNVVALQSRRIIGGVFNGIVQLFTTLNLKDTQCGFKLYPRKAAQFLFGNMKNTGWSHDVELLYQADLNNYQIVEMPIHWVNQPESKINVVKDSMMMFFGVLFISLRLWFFNTFILPFKMPATMDAAQKKQIIYRSIFNVLSVLLMIVMPLMSFRFAITGDEHWHFDYGNDIYNYFFHGDTAAQTGIPATAKPGTGMEPSGIQFYGGLFDFICTAFYNLFHFWDHYTTMHFINALVGSVGIIYAGKLAKVLGGWTSGILAIIFLVCSPSWFGHNFANPKDIPFSVGYTASLYFLMQYLRTLPNPSVKYIVGLILSIGWSMGVRIGGLLLIAYVFLFIACYAVFTKQFKTIVTARVFKQMFVIVVLGYLIAIICWPFAHLGLIDKPLEALKVMSNFIVNIGMLYEGKKLLSNQVPWYYIPKYIVYTAPIIVLVGFALGTVLIPFIFRKNKKCLLFALFVLFSIGFPVFYAIYKHSSLYDGWRHFLFIYPPIVAITAMGWSYLLSSRQKVVKFATVILIAVGLVSPISFTMAYHPHESLYYNEIPGGLKGIYGKYETDYYMLGIKPATEWLLKNEPVAGKKLTIATNCAYPLIAYLEPYKNLSVAYVRFYDRYSKDWDYCILFSRFVDASQLTSGNWPPAETIYTVKVQGVPIAAVLKRKTKKDLVGFELMKAKKLDEAKPAFLASLQEFPENDMVWEALTQIYEAQGNIDSTIYAGNKTLERYPGDITVYQAMGSAYMNARKPDSAIALYRRLEKYNPSYSHFFVGYVYAVTGNVNGAYAELDESIAADPQNEQPYKLAMQLAKQTRNDARAEEYYEKVKKAFPEAAE